MTKRVHSQTCDNKSVSEYSDTIDTKQGTKRPRHSVSNGKNLHATSTSESSTTDKDIISSLICDVDNLSGFPVHDKGNFGRLRSIQGIVYFDRTKYIFVLDSATEDVMIFLRPRRFGKSLTLSMLAHFHGLEHKKNYDKLFKVYNYC